MFENLPEEVEYNYYVMTTNYLNVYTKLSVYATLMLISDDLDTFVSYPAETEDEFTYVADLYVTTDVDPYTLLIIESGYDVKLENIKIVRVDSDVNVTEVEITNLI